MVKAANIASVLAIALAYLGCTGNGEIDLSRLDAAYDGANDALTRGQDGSASDADVRDGSGKDAPDPDAQFEDAATDATVVGTAGCGQSAGVTDGEVKFTHAGRERRYLIYLPQGYSQDQPWPLLFALHGNGGSVSYWNGTDGARNVRGQVSEEAVLVLAEAIEGNWRDYAADSSTWPARIEEELGYFDSIVDDLSAKLCIDQRAIFSMGFSGGGSFSGVLGCRRDYIRAFAAGGSVIYFASEDCVQAPAAWVTMGEMELEQRGTAFRDYFRGAASCSSESTPTEPSPPCVSYDGCALGSPQHYCEHEGGHIWPSFATVAVWSFFEQFAR